MDDATLPMQDIQTEKQLPHHIFQDSDRESILLEPDCLKTEMVPMDVKYETGVISVGSDMMEMIEKLRDVHVTRMRRISRQARDSLQNLKSIDFMPAIIAVGLSI